MSWIDEKWKTIQKRVDQIKKENKSKINIQKIAKEFEDKSNGIISKKDIYDILKK